MVDWSYVAGFLDADGYITFQMNGLKIAAVRVGFTQNVNGISAITEIRNKLNSACIDSSLSFENSETVCRLRISQEQSVRLLLEQIIPHLIIKRDKAIEGINLLDQRKISTNRHRSDSSHLEDDSLLQQLGLLENTTN